jgi:endonuclease/exonuclease/phosphatase family metal-dependent hydrolase
VGAYIPPIDTIALGTITTALEAMPPRLPLILMGDLNADIEWPRDNRATEVAFLAASFGLEDLMKYFRERERFRRGITWRI